LPDVVDKKAGTAAVGVEGEAKGVTQAQREDLLADAPWRSAPAVAADAVGAPKGVALRDVAAAGNTHDLAEQRVAVPSGGVVSRAAATAARIATRVANGDVQKAVFTDLNVSGAVVTERRGDIVDQHPFAA
jgi:hypothetical protein